MKANIKASLSASAAPHDVVDSEYGLGFFVVGYERRSRYIATRLRPNTKTLAAFVYEDRRVLAFDENRKWCEQEGITLLPLSDYRADQSGEFHENIKRQTHLFLASDIRKTIFIDVSSMDRSLIGRLLHSLFSSLAPPFRLRLLYAPAEFVEPKYAFIPLRECAPSIPELSGSLGPHQRNVSLILGLGYEHGIALGLVQMIEPDSTFVFAPSGIDKRYDDAVRKANLDFDFGTDNAQIVQYRVNQPIALFETLFSLTSGANSNQRFIIAPNGPKILAATSSVIALFRAPSITIMRASVLSTPPTHQVEASGEIIAIDFSCEAH